MGFKSLILVTFLIFITIFSLQNLPAISLVFFGFNSLQLPLSIWILISLFLGIFSSLCIQLLSGSFSGSKNDNPSPNSRRYPSTPPDFPPATSLSRKNKVTTSAQTPVDNNFRDEEFDIFDDRSFATPSNQTEVNIPRVKQKPTSVDSSINDHENDRVFSQPNNFYSPRNQQEIKPTIDNQGQAKQSSDTENAPPSPPINDSKPSEAWLKSREASLYSYPSQEKTEINIPLPPLQKKNRSNQKKNNERETKPQNKNTIYDASYRVITPPAKKFSDNDEDLDWDNEDEDWDF